MAAGAFSRPTHHPLLNVTERQKRYWRRYHTIAYHRQRYGIGPIEIDPFDPQESSADDNLQLTFPIHD